MISLFGPLAALFFPIAVSVVGWSRLKSEPIKVKLLLFWGFMTLQICVLLSIHHLPYAAQIPNYSVNSNYIGFHFVRLVMLPVFGRHVFGPYFFTLLAMTITVLYALKIKPQIIAHFISAVAKKCRDSICQAFTRIKHALETSPPIRDVNEKESKKEKKVKKLFGSKPDKENEKEPQSSLTSAALPSLPAPSSEKLPEDDLCSDSSEEDTKKRLEEERAAFRARKHQPITIATVETEEAENDPDLIEETDPDFDDGYDGEGKIPLGEVGSEGSNHLVMTKPSTPTKPYVVPSPGILPDPPKLSDMVDKESIENNSLILEKTLMNFGVEGKVVFVSPGPVVTRYEIELAPGIKVSRVIGLHDDISMAVSGQRIRIEAPIPGKSAVGIELPNPQRQIVHFKHILNSDTFRKTKAKIPVIIGTNISGAPYVTDITKMPHVLIAGQTGSGKSVCINSIICSMLMTKKPDQLRLIMIDPKKVELAFYEGIPHLLSPVVTESKLAVKALQWGVVEMERRYRMLAKVGARNIESFNNRVLSGKLEGILSEEDNKQLPFIVIIVDELADLMMTASKDVEGLIQRIAQLARAVGIHLIVATQRPSVDIITGPIKANLTSRIGFRTIQSTDSRTILGHVGAEKLLGMGDMLFLRNGAPEIERFHGAFISEEDVETIVAEVRKQQVEIEKIDSFQEAVDGEEGSDDSSFSSEDRDELFEEAARTIVSIGQGSTSLLQRRMKIGYARAGRLMDQLADAGIVGPQEGSKVREVLITPAEIDELLERIY
ncbi:Cell division protein FtsK [Chitinispirillum alkaliphilum]|nr:Cell division protein FtsK [Chitinispirillum alkaliphilum]